ncbi:YhfG family protein [Pseudomonas frederiksbergensis]|uniref:YhfG family protein n=1 Tax=Pseudomonas frederiksbergensis TaxID=104087 RepID=UPI0008FB1F0A|nr:YhfG family protein [Pseudomonas frederiksbergensis]
MSQLTFKQKQAHYEKIRRSNYLASLRLAGSDTSPADLEKPLRTREEALAKHRQEELPPSALPPKPDGQ